MNRPVLSFLRSKRFTHGGERRGMSLIELAIVVGLIVAVAAVILLTTANRASNVRLENYANQIAGAVQVQQHMFANGLRPSSSKISMSEFATMLSTLLAGSDDFDTTAITGIAGATNAVGCPGANTAATRSINIDTTLGEEQSKQLATFIQTAIDQLFDGTPPVGGGYTDVFAGVTGTALGGSGGAPNAVHLCFRD